MAFELSKKHQKIIADYIESGKFADARDVIEEALEIMVETESDRDKAWEEFKDKVREGEASLDRGEGRSISSFEEFLEATQPNRER